MNTTATIATTTTHFVLIRHAEKLTWPNGLAPDLAANTLYTDNHQLSAKGLERSHALASYFLHRSEVVQIYAQAPLAAVVCQGVNAASGPGKSFRPIQTISPLRQLLQTASAASLNSNNIDARRFSSFSTAANLTTKNSIEYFEYVKSDFDSMVGHLSSSKFFGKTVIISWSHQTLPLLAVALGAPAESVPSKWGKRFDVTWVVSVNRSHIGGVVSAQTGILRQLPQLLLYGDEKSVIKLKRGCTNAALEKMRSNFEIDEEVEDEE